MPVYMLLFPQIVFLRMTASFGRLSKEWTVTLCDVMNIHCGVTITTVPRQICERWRQLQHIHLLIDAINMIKDLRTDRDLTY